MLKIDLTGKRALVAGVADDGGFGFAIAKALAEAGARSASAPGRRRSASSQTLLERGKMDESLHAARRRASCKFEQHLPARRRVRHARRRARRDAREQALQGPGDFTIQGARGQRLEADFGDQPLDIVVHSLANGPEVKKPLLETSRKGYLGAMRRQRVLDRVDGAALRTAACGAAARSCR